MPRIAKGDSARAKEIAAQGAGRPKGSKDKKWNDLRFWFSLIEDNVGQLKPNELVELGKWGIGILINKMPNIPASPEESVANTEAEKELTAQENAISTTAD